MTDLQSVREQLAQRVCKIVFTKADGTVRTMAATTSPKLVAELGGVYERKTDRVRAVSTDQQAVFDTELRQWRSFSPQALISIE